MTTPPRRMKIGVLSLNANLYSTQRLTEAGPHFDFLTKF